MVKVKNTKENRTVRNAVASLAISNMYFDEKLINELLMVANGQKTSEELRSEIIKKYRK